MGTTQPIRNKDELAAFRMYYKDIHPNRRNYCLIVMGLNTALRISDLLKLKWDNVYNFEHHVFHSHFLINEQKTGKNNYVTLNCNAPEAHNLKNGNILATFGRGSAHVSSESRLFGAISTDGGISFGSEFVLYDPPSGRTGQSMGGVDPATGRIILMIRNPQTDPADDDLGFIYSDDHGLTWSDFTSLAYLFTGTGSTTYGPFGRVTRTANGLMQIWYQTNGNAYAIFSKDNGLTWGNLVTVYEDTDTISLAEPYAVSVDLNRIVVIIRDQVNTSSFRYATSSDGGYTWSAVSDPYSYSSEVVNNASPVNAIRVEDDLLISFTGRSPLFEMFTNRMNIEEFWTEPHTAWAEGAVNRTTFTSSAGAINLDFGYPWILPREGHEYTALLFWYDANNTTGGTDCWYSTFPRL